MAHVASTETGTRQPARQQWRGSSHPANNVTGTTRGTRVARHMPRYRQNVRIHILLPTKKQRSRYVKTKPREEVTTLATMTFHRPIYLPALRQELRIITVPERLAAAVYTILALGEPAGARSLWLAEANQAQRVWDQAGNLPLRPL